MIKVFVVPHTHWDREWYETAARFRQRLVPVVDEIVDVLSRDPSFSCFLLDGQTAMLEDYLTVRPERRAVITELVKASRLLIGPWYVLADELLSSDECLVRNLLAGRRSAESVGGWLRLGYSPDAFGHPAALPTILAGFDIHHGILWRGYGGEPGQESDAFSWVGPDGATVIFHHLPPAGYEFGSALPREAGLLGKRWGELDAVLAPRARANLRLVTAGADHHSVDADLPRLLATLGTMVPNHEFRIASPLDYFAALPESPLPVVKGELRFSYRYTWTLQGVHSTRARLKQRIAEGDRLLIRWAEAQVALSGAVGGEDRRPLLAAAWRDHLLNHPHDSLGGCVTDPVARDVLHRAESVVVQAQGLLVDALHDRLKQNRSDARRARNRWTPTLVLVNPRPTLVSGIVEATITVFQSDVIVGAPDPRTPTLAPVSTPSLLGPDGRPVPMQILGEYDAYERLDSPRDYPDQDRVRAFRVALRATDVPPLGLQRLAVVAGKGEGPMRGSPSASVNALDSRLGGLWDDLALESERDEGDAYSFQPVHGDRPIRGRWSRPQTIWPGPLVAAIGREVLVGDRVRVRLSARVDAGSRLVRLGLDGLNLAGNHRLRIRFPLPHGLRAHRSLADMQYGPATRERRSHDRREFSREWPAATAPMHRYVSVGDGPEGLTVFARGLFEYELTPDGAIAVTLFRAVGELSRGTLTVRAGNAAWPASTPEAQELGPFRAELAIVSLGVTEGSSAEDWHGIEQLAEEFHAPVAGLMLRYGLDVPPSVAGPELWGAGLAFKALKPAEKGDGIVVRCVNVTGGTVDGSWKWPAPVRRATLARLDETPTLEIPLRSDRREIRFSARAREEVTVIVES